MASVADDVDSEIVEGDRFAVVSVRVTTPHGAFVVMAEAVEEDDGRTSRLASLHVEPETLRRCE